MRISTNEFLLGSLNNILSQQQNVNQLNREISSGETMLDASDDPGGAAQVVGLANQIGYLSYDTGNGEAATQTLQNGVNTLTQVSNLLGQLRSSVDSLANGTADQSDRSAALTNARTLQQQLVDLANTQGATGNYIFAGTKSNSPAFTLLSNGNVQFNGDAGVNSVEIAPSLSVPATISGQSVFLNVPAGTTGVAVSASGSNAGDAYAIASGVTNISQVQAASLAGTQYDITFSGSGTSLTYQVTSGTGAPGSASYTADSGVIASGSYTLGSDVAFAGIDVAVSGTPASGDSFAIQPGATTSLFQTVQDYINALEAPTSSGAESGLAQQAMQNVLLNIGNAQSNVLAAQGSLGTSLAEIQSVQAQNNTMSTGATTEMSNLQSANLPQVLANYSEGVTALQAAELAFAKVQNLSLFSDIQP